MLEPASFPAIRCHLGDWAYYSTVLPFSEVASRIQRATEINTNPGLNNMIQRELGTRVSEIAEYLQIQPERFFNAIVVGVYGGAPDWFPIDIDDTGDPQPTNLSEQSRESLGILQLSGAEKLFAVDGQHRVEGIKKALLKEPNLGSEELVVLFVAHRDTREGTARTRRLFTTLNKFAKRVTTNEIIALDEDDAFAVVTRMIVNQYDGLNKTAITDGIEISLVKFKGAQIPSSDPYSVTTIQTLYKLLQILFATNKYSKSKKELTRSLPSEEIIDAMYKAHEWFWEALREHVPAMRRSLGSDPRERMAAMHRNRTGGHILFRPVGQVAFASALRVLLDRGIPVQQGVEALANTQLMLNQRPWIHVMWDPGRNAMSRTNLPLKVNLLLYMAHQQPTVPMAQLEELYQIAVGDSAAQLADISKEQSAIPL